MDRYIIRFETHDMNKYISYCVCRYNLIVKRISLSQVWHTSNHYLLCCAERLCPILCLGGGTPHKPAMLTSTHHVLHEATACADYLQAKQVRDA